MDVQEQAAHASEVWIHVQRTVVMHIDVEISHEDVQYPLTAARIKPRVQLSMVPLHAHVKYGRDDCQPSNCKLQPFGT